MTTPKEALEKAINIIQLWHGEPGWNIYSEHAPEMKLIKAAIPIAAIHQEAVNIVLALLDKDSTLHKIGTRARVLKEKLEALKK